MDKRTYKRDKAYSWKGGKFLTKSGYIAVYKPDHPDAWKSGYILEHRLKVESKIGRRLKPFPIETVNHIDGNKTNNDLNNLEILSNNNHVSLTFRKYDGAAKTCIICHSLFYKHKRMSIRQWELAKYCSLSCSAKGNKSQLYALRARGLIKDIH